MLGPLPRIEPLPEGEGRPWMAAAAPSLVALARQQALLAGQPKLTPAEVVQRRIEAGDGPLDPSLLVEWARRVRRRVRLRRWLHSRTVAQLEEAAGSDLVDARLRAIAAHHLKQRRLGALVVGQPRRGDQLPALARTDRSATRDEPTPRSLAGYTGRVYADTGEPETWRVEVPAKLLEAVRKESAAHMAAMAELLAALGG